MCSHTEISRNVMKCYEMLRNVHWNVPISLILLSSSILGCYPHTYTQYPHTHTYTQYTQYTHTIYTIYTQYTEYAHNTHTQYKQYTQHTHAIHTIYTYIHYTHTHIIHTTHTHTHTHKTYLRVSSARARPPTDSNRRTIKMRRKSWKAAKNK